MSTLHQVIQYLRPGTSQPGDYIIAEGTFLRWFSQQEKSPTQKEIDDATILIDAAELKYKNDMAQEVIISDQVMTSSNDLQNIIDTMKDADVRQMQDAITKLAEVVKKTIKVTVGERYLRR